MVLRVMSEKATDCTLIAVAIFAETTNFREISQFAYIILIHKRNSQKKHCYILAGDVLLSTCCQVSMKINKFKISGLRPNY